ncbi:PLC-like phosphodiesterase [Lasiosphaeria miniovina]|uniref:PLC-like phosphodiesterase n=1 Tax=Lasiosphaeria miniovina TaxID=1954250 RepID=A0AA40BIS8_9PEZI|nr:PLC-like phosphodiesterase [Lasiosphaeria miniovina]KAK0734888.1 PLC-like phosphodiesterase [Lasiosphaeria miniovina]
MDAATNLTIRNITITPLELKLVEHLDPPPPPPHHGAPGGLAKITARLTGRPAATPTPSATTTIAAEDAEQQEQQQDHTRPFRRHQISGVVVQPFSEASLPSEIAPPDVARGEQLRLTFEEPGSPAVQYVAKIPGPAPQPQRSIVMRATSLSPAAGDDDSAAPQKEFTLVYVPSHAFLAIFSSARLASWMAELDSGFPLSALSIPGTHNSPTCYVALPSVRCQAASVRDQLDNGVRFLDVRVSCPSSPSSSPSSSPPPPDGNSNNSNSNLALVHSAFPISLSGTKYFHDLLADIYGFLDVHPSEAVLMSIKREGTGKGTDQQLSRHLAGRYFAGDAARRWWTAPRIPTLGEARGRVVLVRRFHVDETVAAENGGGLGIDGSVWPDNCADGTCGSGQIRLQDYYEIGQSDEILKKITLAQEELERAAQRGVVLPGEAAAADAPPPQLFINFLSASNFFNASCWPDRIAAKINPAIIEYLCMSHGAPGKGPGQLTIGDAATGVVVTDWVGNNGDWDLIRCIVGWNSRLQLKR